MPGLVPGIHALATKEGVDGRDIGERSDAVLRTAMPGHDVEKAEYDNCKKSSVRLDIRLGDDLAPDLDVVLVDFLQIVGRAGARHQKTAFKASWICRGG